MPHDLERVGTISLSEVLPHVPRKQGRRVVKTFLGKKVSLGRKRLRVLASKGTVCPHCGLEGEYAAVERHKDADQYHVHIYGIDYIGDEVEITIDHIIPRARGGQNTWDNLQPMCEKCNTNKGSRPTNVRWRTGTQKSEQADNVLNG